MSVECFPGEMYGKLNWLGSMASEAFAELRMRLLDAIDAYRRRGGKRKLIYIEARRENFDPVLIYVYVHNLPLWGWCKAGFRGAEPLEEFGDHISGFGSATIVCGGLIRQQRVQVEEVRVGWGYPNWDVKEHDGIVDVAVLALGQHCIRVVVEVKGRQQVPVLVCP